MLNPLISVIIPLFNGEKTIGKTLESLAAQDYPKDLFELVIVDDGSKDSAKNIIADFSARADFSVVLFTNPSKGACTARNFAIEHAKGEIIAMTDQDTIPRQNWLSEISVMFVNQGESTEIAGIYGDIATDFDKFVEPLNTTSVGKYLTANCAYRKQWLEKVGLFSIEFPFGRGDSELAYKVIEQGGRIDHAPNVIVYHPLRRFGWKDVKKTFSEAQYDNLLVKKHRKLAREDLFIMTNGLTAEGVALFSILALFVIFRLAAFGGIAVMIAFISLIRSTYKGKPWKDRILAAMLTLVVSGVSVLGRIWGSVKYRKLLI